MEKRGLSAIVTVVLMIALVLVAVISVWGFVSDFVSESMDEISVSSSNVILGLSYVGVEGDNVSVQVKRFPGTGNLTKAMFIISDGVESESFEEEISLLGMEERIFVLNYSGLVKKVSVAPILRADSGREVLMDITGVFEFSDEEVIENIDGLVSWWDFGKDVAEESGFCNGSECPAWTSEGKAGGAYVFNESVQINLGNQNPDLAVTGGFAIETWFFKTQFEKGGIIGKWSSGNIISSYLLTTYPSDGSKISMWVSNGTAACVNAYIGADAYPLDQWNHLVGVFNNETMGVYVYLNGELYSTSDEDLSDERVENSALAIDCSFSNVYQSIHDVHIGNWGGPSGSATRFVGLMDEVRFYNEVLTGEEVEALYRLGLY